MVLACDNQQAVVGLKWQGLLRSVLYLTLATFAKYLLYSRLAHCMWK